MGSDERTGTHHQVRVDEREDVEPQRLERGFHDVMSVSAAQHAQMKRRARVVGE